MEAPEGIRKLELVADAATPVEFPNAIVISWVALIAKRRFFPMV